MRMKKAITWFLLFAFMLPAALVYGQSVAITPGSSAAYVFCAKPKSNCKTSTVGRWIFKLAHDEADVPAAKKPYTFKDDGTSGARLLWNSGTDPVAIDRVYVGYGEYTPDAGNPTRGTFSGIVDMPPIRPASCTALYSNFDYCTIGQPGSGASLDTPYRSCYTSYTWTLAGPASSSSQTGWHPNTGVIDCTNPPASFKTNIGSGTGNCVAHYVQRRGTSGMSLTGGFYYQNEYMYQARVTQLQVRTVSDFTDLTCTPVTN